MSVVVTGGFDDLRSRDVRFLEEASKLGPVHVLLWGDDTLRFLEGNDPKFPAAERLYMVESLRYVDKVTLVWGPVDPDALPPVEDLTARTWVVDEERDTPGKRAFSSSRGVSYRVVKQGELKGFPVPETEALRSPAGRKKVLVTGCYDWFHSGHVRFFEEVSRLGDLYVSVGHDANIRLLKGEGHPLFPQEERRYLVQAVRHVKGAVTSTGHGWLDAEPEIERLKPDIYAVNEDGDKPEKREYCKRRGIEYVVLTRLPKPGLPRRQSTGLRGF
jgi:cytidyltransferase-like protein